MKIKTIAFTVVLSIITTMFFSCSVQREKQILTDINFSDGFEIRGLDSTKPNASEPIGSFTYGNSVNKPSWSIAQWWSGYNIAEGQKQELSENIYKISDETKALTVNTEEGATSTKIKTTEYTDGNWLHFLIEQGLAGNYIYTDKNKLNEYKISEMKQVRFTGNFKLISSNITSGAAQYIIFINIQNLNQNSPDFGRLYHFGIPIYDSRYANIFIPAYVADDTAATSAFFIFALGSQKFLSKPFSAGKETVINKDFLPLIKRAYKAAQEKGHFKNSTFDDLYISSITTGWEVPGVAECEIEMSNLGIYVG